MRIDGVNKNGKRTAIRINKPFKELSMLVMGLFHTQDDVSIHLKEILKEGLKNGLSSDEVKKEIIKEIETLLILNNLIQLDELNKN